MRKRGMNRLVTRQNCTLSHLYLIQILKEKTMYKGSKTVIVVLFALVVLAFGGMTLAQEQVTINWWHINTAEDQAAYWQGLADQFMADHPNVTIEITILAN